MKCKHCANSKLTKAGIIWNKQRYKCKNCNRTSREGDDRVIHCEEKKMRVIRSYLEGVGIRSIERLENISAPMVLHLIRSFSEKIQKKLRSKKVSDDIKDIEILEVDELFSYCQKKIPKSSYGLLLIGTEMKLLISK